MDALDEAGITNFGYDRVAIKKVKRHQGWSGWYLRVGRWSGRERFHGEKYSGFEG